MYKDPVKSTQAACVNDRTIRHERLPAAIERLRRPANART
jgi:hypothetical protein